MLSPEIEEFSPSHARECCEIAKENWRHRLYKVYNQRIVSYFVNQYTPEKFIGSSRKGKIFVVKISNQVIGFVALKFLEKKSLEIARLFIRPEYQNQGIGSLLIRYLENKYRNIERIIVRSTQLQETVNFYKKNGFHIEREMERKINGEVLREYLMVKKVK